jgi:uncharacterized protein YrrD
MLRSLQDLNGYVVHATDGVLGHVTDIYFDDHNWAVRYFIVETGSWLSSRKVLISLFAIGKPDWAAGVLPVLITKEQVKNSPDIDTAKPVSRQHEKEYLKYYGYPFYWAGAGLWAGPAYPGAMLTGVGYEGSGGDYLMAQADDARAAEAEEERRKDGSDPYLRSSNALHKYHIEATDGGMGHVGGLLFDEETWAIRYFIVETSNWWAGHQVLIAPQWIQEISWPDGAISVDLTRQAVKEAPAYDSSLPISQEHEMALHRHHGRAGHWAEEVRRENPEIHVIKSASAEPIHKYT